MRNFFNGGSSSVIVELYEGFISDLCDLLLFFFVFNRSVYFEGSRSYCVIDIAVESVTAGLFKTLMLPMNIGILIDSIICMEIEMICV